MNVPIGLGHSNECSHHVVTYRFFLEHVRKEEEEEEEEEEKEGGLSAEV